MNLLWVQSVVLPTLIRKQRMLEHVRAVHQETTINYMIHQALYFVKKCQVQHRFIYRMALILILQQWPAAMIWLWEIVVWL